ncbi:YqzG/YhdC family protein [Ureibacillus composti]|nr:YqzG/YhdC family protein [Ureibacillus composti]
MRILMSALAILGVLVYGRFTAASPNSNTESTPSQDVALPVQEQVAPAYAKWGRIAMEKVMAKYPNANVIDYLHIGREVGDKTSVEKFKLWLKEDSKEFGVFVNITFNNQTEEIINIDYEETQR